MLVCDDECQRCAGDEDNEATRPGRRFPANGHGLKALPELPLGHIAGNRTVCRNARHLAESDAGATTSMGLCLWRQRLLTVMG
jgi:hypothetical protein